MATNEQAVRIIPKRTHSYNNAPLDSNNGRRNSNPVTTNDIHVTDTGIVREKQGKVYCDNKPPKVELITNGDFTQEGFQKAICGDFECANPLTGWTVNRDGAISVVDGKLKVLNVTNRARAYRTYTGLTIGTPYTLYVTNSAGNPFLGFLHFNAGTQHNNLALNTPFQFVAGSTSANIQLGVLSTVGGNYTYFDDISIEEVGLDWSLGGGWGIGSGVATHNGSTNANISQNVPLVVGTAYDITYTVVNASAGSQIGIAPNSLNIQYPRTSDGTYTETFTASLTNLYIRSLWNNDNPVSIDNISLSRTVLETEYLYHEVLVRDEFNNLVALVRNSNEGDTSTGSYENNQGVKNRPIPRTSIIDGRPSRNINSNGQPTL